MWPRGIFWRWNEAVRGNAIFWGIADLTLREVFGMLAEITGRRAPRLRFPYWLILGAARCDQWLESGLLRRPPAIPLEGIKIARHPMYVSPQKAVSELGLPQSPVEAASGKSRPLVCGLRVFTAALLNN